MKLQWFKNGQQFRPRVTPAEMRAYNDEVRGLIKVKRVNGEDRVLIQDVMALREAQAKLLAKTLAKELPEGEKFERDLSLPEIAEAWDQLDAECFPGPRLCADCGAAIEAEDGAAAPGSPLGGSTS